MSDCQITKEEKKAALNTNFLKNDWERYSEKKCSIFKEYLSKCTLLWYQYEKTIFALFILTNWQRNY